MSEHAWRCAYGHQHNGQRDAAGCPDYIERVWRPACAVEAEMRRIEAEAKSRIASIESEMRVALNALMRAQPDDVLIYLVDDKGRAPLPEEVEVLRRFRERG